MKWKNTDKVDDELIFDGFCKINKKVRKYIHANKNEFGITIESLVKKIPIIINLFYETT